MTPEPTGASLPAMNTTSIESLVREFTTRLTALIEERAAAEWQDKLAGLMGSPGRRGASKRAGRRPARPPSNGGKRTPEALAETQKQLLALVKRKPGLNAEQLAGELGVPTKALVLPIRKLLGEKTIGKKGTRRGTRYSAK